jgi:hypothetical protein
MSRIIKIFDTTLRDGTQGESVSFSVADKLVKVSKEDEAFTAEKMKPILDTTSRWRRARGSPAMKH